ncbi:UNVERIFIED_CONTAM: hypothetical protein HDU68_012872 [Siphonaria sp. JEL0065]|nr:hypothetical protein HDU68_012872 [Siphonaria sp. JEL0065]
MSSENALLLALESFKARYSGSPLPQKLDPPAGRREWISPDGMVSYNSYVYAFQVHTTIPQSENSTGQFNSSETIIFAAAKAALFHDTETLATILADPSMSPKDAKALGRIVSNFDPDVWAKESLWISDLTLLIKALFNPTMMQELLSTRGMLICEASPRDVIWGIGAPAKQVRVALVPRDWKGRNELGKSLARVRDYLLRVLEAEMVGDVAFLVDREKVVLFFSWFE